MTFLQRCLLALTQYLLLGGWMTSRHNVIWPLISIWHNGPIAVAEFNISCLIFRMAMLIQLTFKLAHYCYISSFNFILFCVCMRLVCTTVSLVLKLCLFLPVVYYVHFIAKTVYFSVWCGINSTCPISNSISKIKFSQIIVSSIV